jgi:CHAT domain-containing protein
MGRAALLAALLLARLLCRLRAARARVAAPLTEEGAAIPSRVLVAVAVALLTSACQSTMSIDEARRVTAHFAGRAFVPPPRTTADATAILDQDRGVDSEVVANARTLVDQPPPDTSDRERLAHFYYQRGLAAGAVSRIPQWIDDLSRAAEYAPRMEILNALANAHGDVGNLSRAIDIRQQIAAIRGNGILAVGWWAISIPNQAKLARLYLITGDLESAEAAMRESARLLSESKIRLGAGCTAPVYECARSDIIVFWHAVLAMARGSVLEGRGRFDEAARFYREAIAVQAADATWSNDPYLDLQVAQLALLLVRQGRLLEAESEARNALLGVMSKRGRNSTGTASVLRVLARTIAEQGRYAEAEALARASLEIYARLGVPSDSFLQAVSRMELAAALVGQGRWQAALDEYAAIRTAPLAGDPQTLENGLLDLTVRAGEAIALLKTGQTDQAVAQLVALLERSRTTLGDTHATTAEIRGLLAAAHAARGEHVRALAGFAEATRVLLDRGQEVDDEETAGRAGEQRLRLILGSYISLLASIRATAVESPAGIDTVAEAFRLAEVARGMSVQRSLDAAAARAAAKTPALSDLVRREQDARKQISALYGLMATAVSAENGPRSRSVEDLRGELAILQQARRAIRQQIEREFPAYTQLITPRPPTLEHVRSLLRAGEALISTYVDDDQTFVWAVPRTGPVAFAAAPLGRRALDEIVGALRASLDPGAATLGGIPVFDVARAHRLYAALLEPVADGWRGADTLLIVADGVLAQLPFGLLPTRAVALGAEHDALFANYRQVPWLIRSHAITVLPSVTALTTLRALPSGDPDRRPFIGFGDPLFNREQAAEAARETAAVQTVAVSPQDQRLALRAAPKTQHLNSARLAMLPRLPETAEELRSIALAMNADVAIDVVLGARANEATVKSLDLTRYRVLVFATHGLSPGDLDGLTQPALALSAPDVAGVDGDGLLTMEEILALRLNADWIVLSACNTASAQGAGAEALSGLGRAFFYAGARALLVSNWPVETTSARELTMDLFRRQRDAPTLTRAKALQATMNALIDGPGFVDTQTQRVIFSYAHPIFWAPFTLVGDGGGS